MKKRLFLCLAAVLICTLTVTAVYAASGGQLLSRGAKSIESQVGPGGFTDVPEGSFYYDAVNWAVDKGITAAIEPNGLISTLWGLAPCLA